MDIQLRTLIPRHCYITYIIKEDYAFQMSSSNLSTHSLSVLLMSFNYSHGSLVTAPIRLCASVIHGFLSLEAGTVEWNGIKGASWRSAVSAFTLDSTGISLSGVCLGALRLTPGWEGDVFLQMIRPDSRSVSKMSSPGSSSNFWSSSDSVMTAVMKLVDVFGVLIVSFEK